MKCPGCRTEMTAMMLDGHLGAQVTMDVCASCQAFWFDQFESLQLSAGSTLKLMKFIGEHSSPINFMSFSEEPAESCKIGRAHV